MVTFNDSSSNNNKNDNDGNDDNNNTNSHITKNEDNNKHICHATQPLIALQYEQVWFPFGDESERLEQM